MTTTIEKPLAELVQELPADLRAQVRDFAEFLLARQRRELAQQAKANGSSNELLRLAGSISDPTFVRPPQGESETRLSLE